MGWLVLRLSRTFDPLDVCQIVCINIGRPAIRMQPLIRFGMRWQVKSSTTLRGLWIVATQYLSQKRVL